MKRSPIKRKKAKPRRTTSPRCTKQRCNNRAEIDGLCVGHADDLAWTLFSKFIRERDGICTGIGVLQSACEGLHQAAHIVGRRNYAVRYDPLNVHTLCRAHHMLVDQTGREWAKYEWAVFLLGGVGYDALMERARPMRDRREAIVSALEMMRENA